MIPDSFKQELLRRVDVVDVIERYLPLRKTGANYTALCPFHSEKTPSFTVSPTKQFYHCFGCGAHGNAISFLMEYQGLGYVEAVKALAESVGMKLPPLEPRERRTESGPDLHDVLQRACDYYREQLKDSPRAIEYLKSRGLTGKIAARFLLGYAPPGWRNLETVFPDYGGKVLKEAGLVVETEEGRRYDRFRDRIVFPILDSRGAVIGFGGRVLAQGRDEVEPAAPKYLNSPETPLFEKGRELYGLAQARAAIRAAGRVLVVEGYMDVVALAQHGIEYAVATLGTATTAAHLQKLLRHTDEVIFCFDGDVAGRKAAWHALEVSLAQLADHKVAKFLFLPPEHDPDSFVRTQGREAFEKRLAEARPLSEFLLDELKSRVNTATPEGRARLVHEAAPLLKQLAAPGLRLQILKSLAAAAGISQEEAARLVGLEPPRSASGRVAPPNAPDRAMLALDRKLERELLKCLVVNPALARRLPAALVDESQPEGRALAACAGFEAEAELTPGVVIETFRGSEHEALINRVTEDLLSAPLEPAEAEKIFEDVLRKLEILRIDAELKTLTRKLAAGEGDSRALSALIARKREALERARSASEL